MIRKFKNGDLAAVMQIWLDANIDSHSFISKDYWKNNFEPVKEMMPHAQVYVYEDDAAKQLYGFIGLTGNYIEGLFIRSDVRGLGFGRQLLEYVKSIEPNIKLSVYKKNVRAIRFYSREGFVAVSEKIDNNTGEKELLMVWNC